VLVFVGAPIILNRFRVPVPFHECSTFDRRFHDFPVVPAAADSTAKVGRFSEHQNSTKTVVAAG